MYFKKFLSNVFLYFIKALLSYMDDSSSSESDVNMILHDSSSSSSSSSSSEYGDITDNSHAVVINFLETIAKYSDADFKIHFRLERSTVNTLIGNHNKFYKMNFD